MLAVFAPKEILAGEARVAVTPETVAKLVGRGLEVLVESGAGAAAPILDEAFQEAGAKMVEAAAGYARADLILRVNPPTPEEVRPLRRGALVISFLFPHRHLDSVRAMAEAGVSSFAMDLVPRITKAQRMDALSSQANIAGYKAVLLASCELGKYFPMLMTAAGTVRPAKVVVFGAGVAGLQAIATARRLGAHVEATDIRPAVKEQVESLGARFIQVEGAEDAETEGGYAKEATEDYRQRQEAAVAGRVADADVVITTALIPGRPAPRLINAEMLQSMRPGSVIVDLAAAEGGNSEGTRPDETVVQDGVKILGPTNLPATVAIHASDLYARNVLYVLEHLVPEANLVLDLEDEITSGSLAVHDGQVRHAPTAETLQSGAPS